MKTMWFNYFKMRISENWKKLFWKYIYLTSHESVTNLKELKYYSEANIAGYFLQWHTKTYKSL